MRPLSAVTSARLFVTGATVGPVVDSLHNQCLLKYDVTPISLAWPEGLQPAFSNYDYFFCSSWTIPPLLGVAYVVLGGVLPRLFQALLDTMNYYYVRRNGDRVADLMVDSTTTIRSRADNEDAQQNTASLQTRALIAVTTTAIIIKLSEFLETNPTITDGAFPSLQQGEAHLLIMLAAALSQWAFLDGTIAALLAASITSIGGPLSELPFVASGVWVYLQEAADYFPLMSFENVGILKATLGEDYQSLALSSITGPCYFAVTMDAIALGRWFDSMQSPEET